METPKTEFKPYISATDNVAEFTLKAVLLGALFGIIFGMSTVYLALKAGKMLLVKDTKHKVKSKVKHSWGYT